LPFLRLGETVYRPPHPPRAIAAGPAAVVVDTLRRVDAEADARRESAQRLIRIARAAGWSVPEAPPGAQPGYLRLPLVPPAGAVRREAKDLGVAHGYPLALADLPELAARCRNPGDGFPGARLLARTLLTVPTHSRLSAGDLRRLEAWIRG
jgi:dTDP-4-amino-4,6-dideoxygalactose transaminase